MAALNIPSLVLDNSTFAENMLAVAMAQPLAATAREAKASWQAVQAYIRNASKLGKLYGTGSQRAKAHAAATAKLKAHAFRLLLHCAKLAIQEAKAAKAA